MMTQVVLIRPGATLYDEQHRVQGVLDVPLSDRGRAEVQRLAEKLAGLELAALYCGPGESVLRTADVVGKSLGLRPKRVEELRNLDQGLWQGLQIEEIKRRNFKVYRQWIDDPLTVCPPPGRAGRRRPGSH
jgi:broad specificity phosphatase PhoE